MLTFFVLWFLAELILGVFVGNFIAFGNPIEPACDPSPRSSSESEGRSATPGVPRTLSQRAQK